MAPKINSPADWAAIRSKDPELFAEIMSGDQIDNSDALIETMDKNGVTHALIQVTPNRNPRNQIVADACRAQKLYRDHGIACGVRILISNVFVADFNRDEETCHTFVTVKTLSNVIKKHLM